LTTTIEKMSTDIKRQIASRIGYRFGRYKPLPAARTFHESPAKFRWYFGGNRSGKSEAHIGWDVAAQAMDRHFVRKMPDNAVIWACTQTWPMVGKILWKDKLQSFLPVSSIVQVNWHNKRESIPKEIRLNNGNVIEFKAYEQGRESFQGRSVDYIGCDEQMPHDIFVECQARLMDRRGSFGLSATPIEPQPWLEERLDALPETDMVVFANLEDNRMSRNGYIPDAEIDSMILQWPEETRATRIEGKFASFSGQVYTGWDRNDHVVKPFVIPDTWRKYRGIDLGFANPFVCLWVARNEDEQWYVYQEHYRNQRLMRDHAATIKAYSNGDSYIDTWSDHDRQERAELDACGIETVPAKKNVNAGIEAVQRALMKRGNGKRGLYVFSDCVNTIREFGSYRYPDGTNKRDPKDEPQKVNDHAMDALRYVIYSSGFGSPLVILDDLRQEATQSDGMSIAGEGQHLIADDDDW